MLRIILVLLLGALLQSNAQLIDSDDYAVKVVQLMMENVEKLIGHDSSVRMRMNEFNNSINIKGNGFDAVGSVRLHSAIPIYIESVSLDENTHRTQITDIDSSIHSQLEFRGFEILYDVRFELSEYTADTIFSIMIPHVRYDIDISKKHNESDVKANIQFVRWASGELEHMEIDLVPDNQYTQLIANELRQNPLFVRPLESSFEDWTTIFQLGLDKAVKEVDYPSINSEIVNVQ